MLPNCAAEAEGIDAERFIDEVLRVPPPRSEIRWGPGAARASTHAAPDDTMCATVALLRSQPCRAVRHPGLLVMLRSMLLIESLSRRTRGAP
jgi:hypothetical protein